MLWYLALAWNEVDAEKSARSEAQLKRFMAASSQWELVHSSPGFAVACRANAASLVPAIYQLPQNRGVILGRLFSSTADTKTLQPTGIGEVEAKRIAETRGKYLMNHFWGQYVAFLRGPSPHSKLVMRDPSGGIPCYETELDSVHAYFLRLEDCDRFEMHPYSIDRRYIVGRLAYISLFGRTTGLSRVSTLLAGECVEHSLESKIRQFVWNPLDIARQAPIDDTDEAIRAIRCSTVSSVHAWSSCFDQVLLSLSGGLDSSIVASCLRTAPTHPHVLCQTLYGDGPMEDERSFARLVSASCGFELVESRVARKFRLNTAASYPRRCEPLDRDGIMDEKGLTRTLMRERRLRVAFNGHGGDELFFRSGVLPTAADFVYSNGLSSRALATVLDDARIDGVAAWRVLRRAFQYGVLKKRWRLSDVYKKVGDVTLATPLVLEEASHYRDSQYMHPLFFEPSDIPPGKLYHAALMCYHSNKRYDRLCAWSDPIEISPLLSQPLMEATLRIPLYVLRQYGCDRWLVRKAFEKELPSDISKRRHKATGDHSIAQGFLESLDTIRKILIDGFLVQCGYLDPNKMRVVLDPTRPTQLNIPIMNLLDYLDIEMWCRSWSADSRKVAA